VSCRAVTSRERPDRSREDACDGGIPPRSYWEPLAAYLRPQWPRVALLALLLAAELALFVFYMEWIARSIGYFGGIVNGFRRAGAGAADHSGR